MNNDAPRPEKVLQGTAEEKARRHLSHAAASPNSYYQLLLQKCGSRRDTSATPDKSNLPQVAGNNGSQDHGR